MQSLFSLALIVHFMALGVYLVRLDFDFSLKLIGGIFAYLAVFHLILGIMIRIFPFLVSP